MEKGMMVPFFTEITMERRLDLMKKAGFNNFMLSLDKNHEKFTAPLEDVINYCKKINLKINVGHAGYRDPDVNEFWNENETGNQIEKEYLNYLKVASKYGIKTVVFHMHFETDYNLGKIGLTRLKRLVEFAEENNINIAIENLYSYDELGYIFKSIKSKNLGMCFDSGHENFLTQNAGFLNKYGDKLFAIHLHDNDGVTDQHKTPFTGNINWNYIAKGLIKANLVSLDAEVKLHRPEGKDKVTEEELLELYKAIYKSLKKLENLMNEEITNQPKTLTA